MGGLGNQLFQIAAAAAQAAEHDVDFFIADGDPFFAVTGSHPTKYYDNIYKRLKKHPIPTAAKIMPYNEKGFAYKDFGSLVTSCKKHALGLYINGYFQSERYFEKHANLIRHIFTPDGGLPQTVREQTDIYKRYPELDPDCADAGPGPGPGQKRCLLGVRRGDYIRDAHMISVHNPASTHYYKKAMEAVSADIYYVISDDIAWCRANLPQLVTNQATFKFLEEPDDLITFYFARHFNNYICANSTFHWWASYLSIHPNPIVYTPREHFGPAGPQDYQDYFRKDMITISNNPSIEPEITVNIPLYNGIEYLAETVESVKAQTYKNWTCIIGVNGHGPSGGTVFQKAREIVGHDRRFRVINYPYARCVADVDMAMAADSPTEWIAHVDADDIWLPNKLEVQVAALNGPAHGASIIGTQCTYFGELSGQPAIKTGWIGPADLIQVNHIVNSSTLLKKSAAKYSDRFFCEDYDLWLRSAIKGEKIYNCPEPLVAHRIHSNSHFNASKKQDPNAVREYYAGAEDFTLVTAFYEMRSKYPSSTYMTWINNFYSSYQGHMVIYTEEKYAPIFKNMRAQMADRTRICVVPQSDWSAVKDWPAGFWEAQYEKDHEKYHSPELYMIWYQKNDFVQRTIRANPFGHRKFMWCDAGVCRNPTVASWIKTMPGKGNRMLADKITLLAINRFRKEDHDTFSKNGVVNFIGRNLNGGGILAGGLDAWKKWDEHYMEMLKIFVEKNMFVGKDQNVFNNIALKYPGDVHIVPTNLTLEEEKFWFYLLYYFGCGMDAFLTQFQ